jgi:hypothetical protein
VSGQGKESTGRPAQPWPWPLRLLALAVAFVGVLEASLWAMAGGAGAGGPHLAVRQLLAPVLTRYLPLRGWVLTHPVLAGAAALAVAVVLVLLTRWWLLFFHNEVKARLTGTYFSPEAAGFPSRPVELLPLVRRRPVGTTFLGLEARRGVFGWRWKPFGITEKQRSMHMHVLGKTGSGKSMSVLFVTALQDALDGKGLLFMDAKGSDENVRIMKAIAALSGREKELKVFSLPAWNSPGIFSHTYNMLYVRPAGTRGLEDAGGDVGAVAERVFSVLPLGDNEYYNTQAQVVFTNVCRLLHGMRDEGGKGVVFTMRDVAVCLKGIGADGGYAAALQHCLRHSANREAAREVENQVARLGRDVHKTFSGVVGAVDKFLSPIVNAYAPDLIFEDVLEGNGLVYVQLPSNLFQLQAPAMGKVMLQDVQQEGSLRQVFRASRNQRTFSVLVDEFYTFADLSIIDSLNKLRDANLHYTLAHQSIADLELESKEFATSVWDNTRTKVILNQDNPLLCEAVSKSIGTHQIVERTVRRQQGALFTSLATGDASSKLVETFKLHPNAIKALKPFGQGYCYFGGDNIAALAFGMLPPLAADYALPARRQADAPGLRLEERFLVGHPVTA